MKQEIIVTADGSSTIFIPEWDEHYHSKHGAIQEANHVFLKHGLHYFFEKNTSISKDASTSILEIGFGTGLNAFLTLVEAEKHNYTIDYTGVEGYPISPETVNQLNYTDNFEASQKAFFKKLHNVSWEERHAITNQFQLKKIKMLFSEIKAVNTFDIIYFDAFGARVQPELWTEAIFERMFLALKPKGVLVTYSAKGSVRRAMQAVGFIVERLEGPPGKREMLRAIKP